MANITAIFRYPEAAGVTLSYSFADFALAATVETGKTTFAGTAPYIELQFSFNAAGVGSITPGNISETGYTISGNGFIAAANGREWLLYVEDMSDAELVYEVTLFLSHGDPYNIQIQQKDEIGQLHSVYPVANAANVTGVLPVANGGTGNINGYIRVGKKEDTTIGAKATAEGDSTTASGDASHAEGYLTVASGECTHAEGREATASGSCSHAEGYKTTASAVFAHAEGKQASATGESSHAEGGGSAAAGKNSHAEGQQTKAYAQYSHAEGYLCVAGVEGGTTTAPGAHAEGKNTLATGDYSHAEGFNTIANGHHAHAAGMFNKTMTSATGGSSANGDAMVIGNGLAEESRSNCFRVTFTGEVYGLSSFKTSGADYAEYFEWQDGNPEAEDRVGYFVAMEGARIRLAAPGDYILGIVSGQPCIIGNADEDWLGRWQHDEFGRFLKETGFPKVEYREVEVQDGDGESHTELQLVETGETDPGWRYLANPDYDNTQAYVERRDRVEWDAVGMLGILAVRDDGSCQVNGFCTVSQGGIATAAAGYLPGQTWRVVERTGENVVKIVFR